jgi:hypothetical protein
MKTILLLLMLIIAVPVMGRAQTNSSEAKDAAAVVDKLWEAMRSKNSETMRSLFLAEGQLIAVDKGRDGAQRQRVLTPEAFAKVISEGQGEFIEKMPNPEVAVYSNLAIVHGRYTFHVGEKFSHCGTNTFNLVRTGEGWKIANAVSTLEMEKCERDLQMVAVPTIEANPADVATIDGIIKAFYEVISGAPNQARQWARDKTLYAPGVRFVAMSANGGKIRANLMSHKEYINGSNEFFVKEGFVEREINRVTRRFGNLAHVFSTYEFETTADKAKKMSGRGVNSVELFWDGTRWWISAVTWDEERPDNPIPKDFLPKSKK